MHRLAPFVLGYFFGYLTAYFTVAGKTIEAAVAAAIATAAILLSQLSREVVHPEISETAGALRGWFGLGREAAKKSRSHYRQGHPGKSYECELSH